MESQYLLRKLAKIEGLTKTYGTKQVLNSINLIILEGKIIGLLGPNGSEKSTMIKLMNGLLKPIGVK